MAQTSATNERQIKSAKDRAKRDADVREDIIKNLMANIEGRRYLWNEIAFCRVFIADESTDLGTLAYNNGRRSYGLKLFADIGRYAAKFIPTMMEENSSTIKKDQDDGGSLDDGADSDA